MARKRKVSAAQKAEWAKERQEKVEGCMETLKDGIAGYLTTDKWKGFLRTQAAWLGRYSWRNTLLVKLQMSEASLVMAYKAWRKVGRQVRKRPEGVDQWGLTIVVPLKWSKKIQDEKTGEDKTIGGIRGFGTASVFDISQTDPIEGYENPMIPSEEICVDIAGDENGLWSRLLEFAEHKGIPVTRSNKAEAYYIPRKHSITVGVYESRAMEAMALAHELGHALFRHGGADCKLGRNVKELEAQSVAYIVCQHFGIEADQYSFEYLGSWKGEDCLKVLQTSGKRIVETSQAIVEHTAEAKPAAKAA